MGIYNKIKKLINIRVKEEKIQKIQEKRHIKEEYTVKDPYTKTEIKVKIMEKRKK